MLVQRLAHRIKCCQALLNIMKLARFLVMRAPSLSNRVKLYQPFWRPHNTMIEVQGDVVIKDIEDIEDTATFYAGFEHSFQSIKVVACSMLNVAQLL